MCCTTQILQTLTCIEWHMLESYANRAGKTRTVLSVLIVFAVIAPGPCIGKLTYAQRFGSDASIHNDADLRITRVRPPWSGIDQEILHGNLVDNFRKGSNWFPKCNEDCGFELTSPETTQCITIREVRDGAQTGHNIRSNTLECSMNHTHTS